MSTTYYLGAGASAKSIPCVADLAENIQEIVKFVRKHGNESKTIQLRVRPNAQPIHLSVNKKACDTIVSDFCKELSGHLSIDTYAKILYAQNHKEKYLTLKAILYASFLVWKIERGIDNRYFNFWATLMNLKKHAFNGENSLIGFGNGLNIISWNYDTQLEDSLISILEGGKHNQSYYTSDIDSDDVYTNTNIPYIKLNGSAYFDKTYQFSDSGERLSLNKIPDSWLAHLVSSIILNPEKFKDNIENIKFCWEAHVTQTMKKLDTFQDKIANTETLVIIGYSFPSINHGLDIKIIESMSSLKKVYFQGADKADSERIKDYFIAVLRSFREIKLIPIDSKGFFIPPEATVEMEKPNNSFDIIFS